MLILITGVAGFLMAFAIGANDVANSMATAVGAKAITPRQATIIAGILEFLGAVLFGSHVAATITRGIVKPEVIPSSNVLIAGALAALTSSFVWVIAATLWGMPVSTTHSIVGGMMGFGLAAAGWKAINWQKMIPIVSSWVLSPLVGGLLAYVTFKSLSVFVLKRPSPRKAAIKATPVIVLITIFIISFLFCLKTLKIPFLRSFTYSILLAAPTSIVTSILLKVNKNSPRSDIEYVENIFKNIQVMTSCYMALSHGANDVANAIGPLAVVYLVVKTGLLTQTAEIPIWTLMIGGLGISLGVLLLGYKVMKTIGTSITELTNTRGFCIDFSAASTVLIASVLGMPISTTHTVVGAVVGVGLARGVEVVNVGVLKNIVLSWLLTVPLAAGLSAILFELFIKIV
ncbi:inorganic phosphate transporter [Pseudothermotoga thermarum]|uniref:Phosphate transporter n=1 Tax=Pseudothermotoga thermarum DSM 5069 TaxID=688269 RepID=F7YY31_9THEM|nr:phosphate transporter [Pseudothermotoga thermarum DSM 5069]